MEREYKITFTTDYIMTKEWADGGDKFYQELVADKKEELQVCKKYFGKTIKLSEIPAFVKEVGECVISEDEIEVYNDYRE